MSGNQRRDCKGLQVRSECGDDMAARRAADRDNDAAVLDRAAEEKRQTNEIS